MWIELDEIEEEKSEGVSHKLDSATKYLLPKNVRRFY